MKGRHAILIGLAVVFALLTAMFPAATYAQETPYIQFYASVNGAPSMYVYVPAANQPVELRFVIFGVSEIHMQEAFQNYEPWEVPLSGQQYGNMNPISYWPPLPENGAYTFRIRVTKYGSPDMFTPDVNVCVGPQGCYFYPLPYGTYPMIIQYPAPYCDWKCQQDWWNNHPEFGRWYREHRQRPQEWKPIYPWPGPGLGPGPGPGNPCFGEHQPDWCMPPGPPGPGPGDPCSGEHQPDWCTPPDNPGHEHNPINCLEDPNGPGCKEIFESCMKDLSGQACQQIISFCLKNPGGGVCQQILDYLHLK